MGIIIKSVSTSTDPLVRSSISHAVLAARSCVKSAGIAMKEVDLLFNVGIYRDSNMVEPAMAALIQKELALNLDYVKFPTEKPTASFDVMNGPCGFLNAVQAASAFLTLREAEYVLVVSSDAHPASEERVPSHTAECFPFARSGAAALLENSNDASKGFGRIRFKTSSAGFTGLDGYSELYKSNSRNEVIVQEHPEYQKKLLSFLTDSVREYVQAEELTLKDTLLISSQVSSDFASKLGSHLGLSHEACVQVPGNGLDSHSSALLAGYHYVVTNGLEKNYKQILFAIAGGGLTSACAIYRV